MQRTREISKEIRNLYGLKLVAKNMVLEDLTLSYH